MTAFTVTKKTNRYCGCVTCSSRSSSAGGVDLVLAGHDHHYDRSTLQPAKSPTGQARILATATPSVS